MRRGRGPSQHHAGKDDEDEGEGGEEGEDEDDEEARMTRASQTRTRPRCYAASSTAWIATPRNWCPGMAAASISRSCQCFFDYD